MDCETSSSSSSSVTNYDTVDREPKWLSMFQPKQHHPVAPAQPSLEDVIEETIRIKGMPNISGSEVLDMLTDCKLKCVTGEFVVDYFAENKQYIDENNLFLKLCVKDAESRGEEQIDFVKCLEDIASLSIGHERPELPADEDNVAVMKRRRQRQSRRNAVRSVGNAKLAPNGKVGVNTCVAEVSHNTSPATYTMRHVNLHSAIRFPIMVQGEMEQELRATRYGLVSRQLEVMATDFL